MAVTGGYQLQRGDKRLILAYIFIALAHLAVGILLGFMQGMQHAGIDLYKYTFLAHYYQGLSIHGVYNALVFTTFFIAGFLHFAMTYSLKRPMHSTKLSWFTFWLMTAGLIMVDWALLTNRASVLYTSYAPLQAHPAYYIGLVLVVVGTLLLLANCLLTYLGWRRDHPGQKTPLPAFGVLATLIMWGMASVGIAVQFIFLLIPWSLGLTDGVDPLVSRTLFWFTGHPLVYFWLLPVYISWYFMLPKQAGGKLFSEPLARLAFLLFIPLSLPVGFHHQFLDPGVSTGYKAVHAFITFGVFMPSMLTAFTVLASIESGGRARGGKGRLAWIKSLPWNDPSFTAQVLAMLLFALGGISGLVNASFTVNLVVHNTMFVPGHFHLTVGTATAMTFMAVAYWLVPYLAKRKLWGRRVALVQSALWFVGMAIMSRGMSWAGLMGVPRRTALGSAPYVLPEWLTAFNWMAVGGAVLTISGLLFFVVLIMTVLRGQRAEDIEVPLAEPLQEETIPWYLDRFRPWVIGAAVLVLMAYGPAIAQLVSISNPASPGFMPY
jgi:Heme/copper-type cytochrome/quinol oxidases, subunit 1